MQFNSIKSYLYSAKCHLKALQRYNPIRVQFITFKIHTDREHTGADSHYGVWGGSSRWEAAEKCVRLQLCILVSALGRHVSG